MKKNTLQIIELLLSRFSQIEIPTEFIAFIHNQEENEHRLYRYGIDETLISYFQRRGISPRQYNSFLTQESQFIPQIDYSKLISLPPDEVYSHILDNFNNLFYLQEIALETETSTGFNRHGQEHLRSVVSNALLLLKEEKITPDSDYSLENEAIIGGFFHDIGNLIARQYHGLFGIYLLTRLFVNYDHNKNILNSFVNVLECVLFHEVEYGSKLQDLSLLCPSTLGVIIADKTDIHYKRVSSVSNIPEAIQDAHVLINLLVSKSSINRIKGVNGHFRWIINFRSKYDHGQKDLFSRLLKITGRVKLPDKWHSIYDATKIEYLFIFNSTFLSVYLTRMFYAISAAFALYPSIDEFLFVVDDAERGIRLTRTFTKNDYKEKIFALGKLLFKQDWQKSYMYKAIKINAKNK
jgi:metal-dependent HD superfamily phosphatase/phosphodiesterase